MTQGTAISSGAIVLGEVDGRLRLAMAREPDKGENAYVLPKGHVEPDESNEQAALREISEEIGLDNVQLLSYLGTIERESTEDSGDLVLKTIHMWLAFCPEPRALTDGGQWLTPQEAAGALPFAEDREFLVDRLAPLLSRSEAG